MRRILRAVRSPIYYRAAWNTLRYFKSPLWVLSCYLGLFRSGFPTSLTIDYKGRSASFTVFTPDDVVTAIECFGKQDYAAVSSARCVVDFGSNIGISVLYFLTHFPESRVYAYEPDPKNIERLRLNLSTHADRYELDPSAVGAKAGRAKFGREPTGRYGGLGLDFPDQIEVEVRDADEILCKILAIEGVIDLLKIDVEGQERAVLLALSETTLRGIRSIAVELSGASLALPGFRASKQGGVVTYVRE
ncbi:MAG: FkbM family methyltransferase [Pseudomonadota bacterium]|nr:FkbM family methyltransferase [Pseudomonadota bacterium]